MRARWIGVEILLVGVLLSVGVGLAGQQPPPPAPVPPNASLVTAAVLKYSIWNSTLLQNTRPELLPGLTLYSLVVEVQKSERVGEQMESFAKAGDVVEAFAVEALAPDLFGKKIEATLKLSGDTRGVRWWVSQIRVLLDEPPKK